MKKSFFLSTAILVTFISVHAQRFSNQKIIMSPEADGANYVNTADLDGDGDQDVLSASDDDNKIAWYENINGSAKFNQKVISTNADNANSVHTVDIDGDGDKDVFSSSWADNKVAWYENKDGLGNFSCENIITTKAQGITCAYFSDLDNDGDNDILSGSAMDDKIAWYENLDGKGTFSEQKIIDSTVYDCIESIYTADLDNDNDQDLLFASWSTNDLLNDKIGWFENKGDGRFSEQKIITTNANVAHWVYATDLDGDNDKDVISASSKDDKIAWYINKGNASATFSDERVITKNADYATSVYTADIDGDGDPDVLSSSSLDNKIAWYENLEGSQSFSSQYVITVYARGAWSVNAADLDGDGDQDVLSASGINDKIAWYENINGSGNFNYQRRISKTANGAESVFTADLDNDGDQDVLSASHGDSKIAWYENTEGTGTFGGQQIITINAISADEVYATDIDCDGDQDVLSACSYWDKNKIAWYKNIKGEGNFSMEKVITTDAPRAESVYSADLDGDGDQDVLSASLGSSDFTDKIAWYENTDCTGNFGNQQIITTQLGSGESVYSADIDGDGDMDVISANRWYENTDGNGNFTSQQQFTYTNYQCSYDLDGDHDQDLLSAFDNFIVWYENVDGEGNFGDRQVITENVDDVKMVHAADLDSDGDSDVFSASKDDDKIAWYENIDSSETFGVQQVITTNADAAESVHATDLDGDSDQDLLSASANDNKIAWYENLTYGIKSHPKDTNICPEFNASFSIKANGANSYQWQIDKGNGFINLSDNASYSGVTSPNLQIFHVPNSFSGYQYQCVVSYKTGEQISNAATLVVDGKKPVPGITTLDTIRAECSVNISDIPTAMDNCAGKVEGTTSDSTSFAKQGKHIITWIYNDGNGNISTQKQTVIINDTTNPLITCTNDQTIYLAEDQTFYTVSGNEFDPVEIKDNCNVVAVSNDFNGKKTLDGEKFMPGKDTIIWTVKDVGGNTQNCKFILTINDYVGIAQHTENTISIYPNPTNGIINIKLKDINIHCIKICDITGKTKIEKTNIRQNETMDLSNLESGYYIIRIEREREIFIKKIVIK